MRNLLGRKPTEKKTNSLVMKPYESLGEKVLDIREQKFTMAPIVSKNGSGYSINYDVPGRPGYTHVHAITSFGRIQEPIEIVEDFVNEFLREKFGEKYISHKITKASYTPKPEINPNLRHGQFNLEGKVIFRHK